MQDRFLFIKENPGVILIALLFFAMCVLRLNGFSYLTPDSAIYLILGNSVAHGHGFVDPTTPIPDRFVSRGALFPVILAPVELLFPLSLIAAKVWTAILGAIAIVLFYRWIKSILGKKAALVAALLLALNPMMFVYSSEVLSEIPFLIAVIVSFTLAARCEGNPLRNSTVILLALSVSAAALLRDIGLSLVIAAVAYLVIRKGFRAAFQIALISGIFLGIWLIRDRFLVVRNQYSEDGYLSWLTMHVGTAQNLSFARELIWRCIQNLGLYLRNLGGMIFYPLFTTIQFNTLLPESSAAYSRIFYFMRHAQYAVVLVAAPLMVLGIYRDLQTNRSALFRLFFLLVYLGGILIFPMNDLRYHFPLLALMIYYLIGGAIWIKERGNVSALIRRPIVLVAFTVVAMIPNLYGDQELIRNNANYQQSPSQPWAEIGAWINAHLPDSVIIATPSKDLSPFIGNRFAFTVSPALDLPQADTLLRDSHVDYLVAPPLWGNSVTQDWQTFGSARFWFEPVFHAGSLHLLKVHSTFREPQRAHTIRIDISTTDGMMQLGRIKLLQDDLPGANRYFLDALEVEPTRGDIVAEAIGTYAMMADTVNAMKYYQKLLLLPSGAIMFYLPAMRQLDIMNNLTYGKRSSFFPTFAIRTSQAASLYWKLGYYRHAARMMDTLLTVNNSYMFGLLWGLHYHLQIGDTAMAKTYLRKLEQMDSTNIVVESFHRIFDLADSLRVEREPRSRSNLRLAIASIYRTLELPETAIDEGERAIGEDHTNINAYFFIALVFSMEHKDVAAEHAYRDARQIDPHNAFALNRIALLTQHR